MKGPFPQYLNLSEDEIDCQGNPGNKGRNYSLIGDPDHGLFWYWPNTGSGAGTELCMCLWLCDAVTIPVNIPGVKYGSNPFSCYGFDTGPATLTPLLSSGSLALGFMTQDYTGLGGMRIVLASFASQPCIGPFSAKKFRIPHGFDALTRFFVHLLPVYGHNPVYGYPACMFGTTAGGNSMFIPFPPEPGLLGSEIRYSTYAFGAKPGVVMPMSASFMATYF